MRDKNWFPQPIYYKNLIEPTILSPRLPHKPGFLPQYLRNSGVAKSKVFDKQKQDLHIKPN